MEINTNNPTTQYSSQISTPSTQLSSGKKVNSGADAPASIQIIEQLNSQISSNNAAYSNTINGDSALQIAQGGLSSISDSLHQLRELGIQAGNGALNSANRDAIQNQANELLNTIKDSISNSRFNSQSLLDNDFGLTLQTGAKPGDTRTISTSDLNQAFADVSLFDISLSSQSVSDALSSIDEALTITEKSVSHFASAQIGLQISSNNLTQANEHQAQSLSLLEDTDYAAAVSQLTKENLKEDVEVTLLAQANANRGEVLQLLKF